MLEATEHKFLNFLKKDIGFSLPDSAGIKLLLAVSGGVDSMVLLHLFHKTQKLHSMQLQVACVHHGDSPDSAIQNFRDKSLDLVRQNCIQLNIPFQYKKLNPFTLSPTLTEVDSLKDKGNLSESTYRQFRYDFFNEIIRDQKIDYLLTAHHMDDLIETRLMRMLRGVGAEGLVAMWPQKGQVVRPLLAFTKQELCQYADKNKIKYLDDPSNESDVYLRNWMRKHWLMPLRQDHPEMIPSLFRSLQNLSNVNNTDTSSDTLSNQSVIVHNQNHPISSDFKFASESEKHIDVFIQRELFSKQTKTTKLKILRNYITQFQNSQGTRNALNLVEISEFRHSQLEEIMKQIDKTKKVHSFTVNSLVWHMNEKQIWVEILSKKK